MIVVADTSPVNYLVLIDEIDLLPIIFGKVLIPEAVMEELQHPRTPPKVRQWIVNLASWIEVRCSLSAGNTDLMGLDIGNATRSSRSNWEWQTRDHHGGATGGDGAFSSQRGRAAASRRRRSK